jgi:predicted site-specific integrase-resolvase
VNKVKRQEVHLLNGDKLLDNQDMCQLFGVCKRTIARYRQKKLIRFYTIRGKVWYKASEVEEFLKKKGKN